MAEETIRRIDEVLKTREARFAFAKSVAEKMAENAALLNIDLATIAKMADGKDALKIPVAVTERKGGRSLTSEFPLGKEILTAIVVRENTIFKEYLLRKEDETLIRIVRTPSGRVFHVAKGKINIIEKRVGYGEISWETTQEIADEYKPLVGPPGMATETEAAVEGGKCRIILYTAYCTW